MQASLPDTRSAVAGVLELLDNTYRDETWVWDPQHVADRMEIVAGAVLVQHTTWTNAERALDNLRHAGALDPARLAALPEEELTSLVRVSGTPTVKARRLRAIARTIVNAGALEALLALPPDELRARLLATHGIGAETADAIMLYAAGRRVFVIDAYTRRMFERIGSAPADGTYDAWQRYLEDALPDAGVRAFQRHHAHIVMHAKGAYKVRLEARPLTSDLRPPATHSAASSALAHPGTSASCTAS
jgi:endonuclease-3 related protein